MITFFITKLKYTKNECKISIFDNANHKKCNLSIIPTSKYITIIHICTRFSVSFFQRVQSSKILNRFFVSESLISVKVRRIGCYVFCLDLLHRDLDVATTKSGASSDLSKIMQFFSGTIAYSNRQIYLNALKVKCAS